MWVVEPSRSPRAAVGGFHRRDQLLGPAALAVALEQAEAVGDQRSSRGGRWVGQHLGTAEASANRLALDRPVGGEVAGAERAAAVDDVLAQSHRDLAAAEGLGAFGTVAFQRLGELGKAKRLTLSQGAPGGRV